MHNLFFAVYSKILIKPCTDGQSSEKNTFLEFVFYCLLEELLQTTIHCDFFLGMVPIVVNTR